MKTTVNQFLLFVCLSAISFLTVACSNDDATPISQETLTGEDATISLNGTVLSSGTAQMDVVNSTQGILHLGNVVPGHDSTAVSVTLEEQEDGTYNFTGATKVRTSAATKAAASSEDGLTAVNLNGSISKTGKMKVAVNVGGIGLFVGLYHGDKLNLTYSGTTMSGKFVVYSIINSKPVLTLVNIIPGEVITNITDVKTSEDSTFSGEATTSSHAIVEYAGSLDAATGVLSLNLNVTLSETAQGGITGTWPLSDTIISSAGNKSAPFLFEWTAVDSKQANGHNLAEITTLLGSHCVAEFLNGVTLTADGNLTATYYNDIITGTDDKGAEKSMTAWIISRVGRSDIQPLKRTWMTSSPNTIQWYAKDGEIYLLPNLPVILDYAVTKGLSAISLLDIVNVLKKASTSSQQDSTSLSSVLITYLKDSTTNKAVSMTLIKQVASWMIDGIPLKYAQKDSTLRVYADKEMAAAFMPLLLAAVPHLQLLYDKVAAADKTGILKALPMLMGLKDWTDLENVWYDNTDNFEIGLTFAK